MRTQWINLCDTGHGSHKGTSDRTTGAHQIAVLIGLPHQLLCDDVHDGKAVGNDGIQFTLQTLLHDLRQRIPVHLVGLIVADIPEHLIRIFNDRRALVRTNRRNFFNLVKNLLRIGNYDFLCLFFSAFYTLNIMK